jgi:hypothetical protein
MPMHYAPLLGLSRISDGFGEVPNPFVGVLMPIKWARCRRQWISVRMLVMRIDSERCAGQLAWVRHPIVYAM